MVESKAEALVVGVTPFFVQQQHQIVQLAVKHRLRSIAGNRSYAEAGGLMSYGQNIADNFRHAATYVDKILKGAKAGELPVEQPTTLEFVSEPQDRQGSRPCHPAVVAVARGRGYSVAERVKLIAVECPVLVRRNGWSGSSTDARTPVLGGSGSPFTPAIQAWLTAVCQAAAARSDHFNTGALEHIANVKPHQVAPAQLAVDGEIEQREFLAHGSTAAESGWPRSSSTSAVASGRSASLCSRVLHARQP